MCARLRAQIFDHTHQYVMTFTYSAYITAIIWNVAAIFACHSYKGVASKFIVVRPLCFHS